MAGISLCSGSHHHHCRHQPLSTTRTRSEGQSPRKPTKKEGQEQNTSFDITKEWNKAQNDAQQFWNSIIFTENKEKDNMKEEKESKTRKEDDILEQAKVGFDKVKGFLGFDDDGVGKGDKDGKQTKVEGEETAGSFQEMATDFVSLLSGGGSESTVRRIVKQARESAEEGDIADKKSLEEVLDVLQQYAEELKKTADKYLGNVDVTNLYPTSLFYFMEYQDSIKTPSWKRRMHRFFPGIDIKQMEDLNDNLQLSLLSYADTVEEIKDGLENNKKTPYELVYVNLDSTPNRPAHFVAVKRSQAVWSPYLEVTMCVRGTKTITDAIADLMCDDVPYKDGRAHSGVLEAGQALAAKHRKLFDNLLKSSGKRKIKLNLLGHSLGAGAASIVGMELKEDPKFDINVIGFGCPALLSKELSESTKSYITTVVADDDCVPRLSAAAIVNALLDIMEYDYLPSARRDVEHALTELNRLFPALVTPRLSSAILDFVSPLMDEHLTGTIKKPTDERMKSVLFPPGNCVHFYRDGVGVTGSTVPCDFFHELDITRRMVDDHLIFSGYESIFLELMRQHHQDHNFKFGQE